MEQNDQPQRFNLNPVLDNGSHTLPPGFPGTNSPAYTPTIQANGNAKESKLDLINRARTIIRGERTHNRDELNRLVKKLERKDQFSYATEVMIIRMKLDQENNKAIQIADYGTLAKYIYKDHSLPSSFKFKKALKELGSHEDLTLTKRCETLGLTGAIYKRMWQFDHQFRNLTLACYYYRRGFEQWKYFMKASGDTSITNDENDNGYNAINYAYINDLMAIEKMEEFGIVTGLSENILSHFSEAAEARKYILEQFISRDETKQSKLKRDDYAPWVIATIAEAYFGLNDYEQAEIYIKLYNGLAEVQPWEKRSFSQQFFSLAYLQNYTLNFQKNYVVPTLPHKDKIADISKSIATDKINKCLSLFNDNHQSARASNTISQLKKEGKLGLALSGGGFRSALFHIGVLASLAERDELRNIEVISCVSGGSIIGAYYYLKLKTLLESKADVDIKKDDYISLVREIEEGFLKGIQHNLRMRIFSDLGANFKMFRKDYSRTHRLGELYEKYLFKDLVNIKRSPQEIEAGKKDDEIYMSDLFITPLGVPGDFSIVIDNWKRSNKVPQLVLNATSINTGHNWQFTASWMGEPPGNIQTDIDVKPRLRRMYYPEAPGKYKNFRLGYAVGASSCVPVMFHPMPLPDLYEGIELQLVDGGVHDNQGINALIEQECLNMIISDGSGQMATNTAATQSAGSLFLRADLILQERLRELQFLDIKQRNNTTQVNNLYTVHLKSDLENGPISWKYCTDPPRTIMYNNINHEDNDLTRYGILRKIQLHLSLIRTDLDSFNDVESYALMYSGYAQMNYEYNRQNGQTAEDSTLAPEPWNFLQVKPFLTEPVRAAEKEKIFREAHRVPLKVFYLSKPVKICTLVILIVLAGTLLYIFYPFNKEAWNYSIINITVKVVMTALFLFLLGLFSKVIATLANFKSFLRKKLLFVVIAIFGYLVCKIYLGLLNGEYNRSGQLKTGENEKSLQGDPS